MTLLSFHGYPEIKQKYIDRVKAHMRADNFIQGTGWEDGKGCAVGCTLENYDHSSYPIELGIPEWLAWLEDRIFEGLSNENAMKWPLEFLQSIPVGVDLDKIKTSFLIVVLKFVLNKFDHDKYYHVFEIVNNVLNKLMSKQDITWEETLDCKNASASASAYASAYAADAAAYAAYAASASAYAAAYASASASASASAAASAADASATYKYFSNKLLELLKECK